MQAFRYTKPQVAIHWLAAALIAFLLVLWQQFIVKDGLLSRMRFGGR